MGDGSPEERLGEVERPIGWRGNSPSFLVAVALAVVVVTGYVGWRIWSPNPARQSDRIARQFARDVGREVNHYRRTLKRMRRKGGSHQDGAPGASMTARAAAREARKAVDRLAEQAEERLDEIDKLSLRTYRNRLRRIRRRLDEARKMIEEETARARAAAGGQSSPTQD